MKVSIYMALSANGLIANERIDPYWLSEEYALGFMAICEKTQAVVMGKISYDMLAPNHLPLNKQGMIAVLSHNTKEMPANPAVIFTNKEPKDIVDMFEKKGFREIVVIGGTIVVSEFLQAGVVNDLYLIVEPVLFGSGLPLFKGVEFEYKLSLLGLKKLNESTVQLHYQLQDKIR